MQHQLTLHRAFLFAERDLLVDDSSGTFNGNFLEVVDCSLLWTLQARSYDSSRKKKHKNNKSWLIFIPNASSCTVQCCSKSTHYKWTYSNILRLLDEPSVKCFINHMQVKISFYQEGRQADQRAPSSWPYLLWCFSQWASCQRHWVTQPKRSQR